MKLKDIHDQNIINLIKAAIEVNLIVPVNIDDKINIKLNNLEKALEDIGVNPRRKL